MSEPRHPITLLADLPSLPGIYLERDDTPFLHEAFPIRHHRSKAHLARPGVSKCLIDEPTTLPHGWAPAPPVILRTTALQDSEFDRATSSLVSPSDNCPRVDISLNHRMSTPLDSVPTTALRDSDANRAAVSPASPSEPSSTSGSLDFPPSAPEAFEYRPKPADIYVHHDEARSITQVWIWSGDQWTEAGIDTCHPTLPGYRLKLLDSGEPSWVTRKTMVTDQGRVKRKHQV
ncbi:hypothetical protein BKA82DRAFT_4050832 [Pisolithus tinctorius]|nr:hypothetical protein BKA82DRAFT_4050832 [Pisolithus tinctorius]